MGSPKKNYTAADPNPSQTRSIPRNNRRELKADFRALEHNDRGFVLSFSSEEPYRRFFGDEILDHSDGAVDLTRLNEIGVVLFNHNTDYVVGKIKKAWVEEDRGNAEIEFDSDSDAEKIYQKVKSGTLKGVSVGYVVNDYEEVKSGKKSKDGRFDGPCFIATDWQPLEISIVSVPADETVGVGREMNFATPKLNKSTLDVNSMTLKINKNLEL